MPAARLRHPAVDAALSAASALVGMEVVYVSEVADATYTFARMHGDLPGLHEGWQVPYEDTLCRRMLAGAPPSTSDAEHDPHYRDAPTRVQLGLRSYVGVPVRDAEGRLVGTLCGADRGQVAVTPATVDVLRQVATVLGAVLGSGPRPESGDGFAIRRTAGGWRVGDAVEPDLTSAMTLADLLAGDVDPGARPPRPEADLDELGRLRLAVTQLEHALAARVVVEQAIGVLAERQHLAPRAAFDRLRKAARSRGRRVHDVSREVVASATDPTVPLPPELMGRR